MSKAIRKVYGVGDEFIDLTLLELKVKTQGKDTYHLLKCRTCSKTHILRARDFNRVCCSLHIKFVRKLKHDLTGLIFHQWKVIELDNPHARQQHKRWKCVSTCCGDTKIRAMRDIRRQSSPCKCQLEAKQADKAERYKSYDFSHPSLLNPRKYPYVSGDFIDYDYIHKLNAEEKAWLARFTAEYYGNFKDVDPSKCLHKTPEQLQSINEMKVQERRDIYNQCTRLSIPTWDLELDQDMVDALIDSHLAFIRSRIQSKKLQKAA